jgi:hypothetical protein
MSYKHWGAMSETDRALVLRAILEALAARLAAKAGRAPEGTFAPLDFKALEDGPMAPRWVSCLERAARDGIEESLHASIREEGWRAFASGGLDAMRDLADRASGESNVLYAIIDHRWDGIGAEASDYWSCDRRSQAHLTSAVMDEAK